MKFNVIKASIAIGALVCSLQAVANSKWVRLSWDGNRMVNRELYKNKTTKKTYR